MPLVIFNFYYDDLVADKAASPPGQNFIKHSRSVQIPREAMDSKWTLVAVNANFNEDKITDFASIDLEIPQLMTTQTVLYSNVVSGDAEIPRNALRFYTKMRNVSEFEYTPTPDTYRELSSYGVVSEYPMWSFGHVKLETTELTCNVIPRKGNVADTHESIQLNGVSIILSYEQ